MGRTTPISNLVPGPWPVRLQKKLLISGLKYPSGGHFLRFHVKTLKSQLFGKSTVFSLFNQNRLPEPILAHPRTSRSGPSWDPVWQTLGPPGTLSGRPDPGPARPCQTRPLTGAQAPTLAGPSPRPCTIQTLASLSTSHIDHLFDLLCASQIIFGKIYPLEMPFRYMVCGLCA